MRVLVTGGRGYIGSHLANALVAAGHEVRVLDIQPADTGSFAAPGLEFVTGSVTDRTIVARALQDVEAVYHLAWGFLAARFYPEIRPEEERREMLENLLGTLNLLEASAAAAVRHFIFAGSAVVYGPTGPTRVSEEHACYAERATLGGPVYGLTKLACEKLCLLYQQRGVPVTVFRLHGVFSAGNLGQFGPMIEQALAGEPVRATARAGGEYAHIEDVQNTFLQATGDTRARGQVFNLAGSYTYDEPTLAGYVIRKAGSESQLELVEDPTQEMVSVSVEKLGRVLGCQPTKGEFLTGLIGDAIERARSRRPTE